MGGFAPPSKLIPEPQMAMPSPFPKKGPRGNSKKSAPKKGKSPKKAPFQSTKAGGMAVGL